MPRNQSEKDPHREALMAYARAAQAFLGAKAGGDKEEARRLVRVRKACFERIPRHVREAFGAGGITTCTLFLERIREHYGVIDAA